MRNKRFGVEDLWTRKVRDEHGNTKTVPSIRAGRGLRWRATYVDDVGKRHTQAFPVKAQAKAWLREISPQFITGTYVAPSAGKLTVAAGTSRGRSRKPISARRRPRRGAARGAAGWRRRGPTSRWAT